MADFVKKTWACGDSITAEELNRLEGGVEEALDCCGDYSCEEGYVTVYDATVEIERAGVPIFNFASDVTIPDVDTLIVTFNGTQYTCPQVNKDAWGYGYGDWQYESYPFYIYQELQPSAASISTENVGTYTLKIETAQDVVYNGNVTTDATGESVFRQVLIPDEPTVKIIFDGTEYLCEQICRNEEEISSRRYIYRRYGGYNCEESIADFSAYPFYFSIYEDTSLPNNSYTSIGTKTHGTHSFKVEVIQETVETSECFGKAVRKASTPFVIRSNTASDTGLTIQRGSFNELVSYFNPSSLELIEPLDMVYIRHDSNYNDGYQLLYLNRARAVKVDGEIAYIKLEFDCVSGHCGVVLTWLPDDTVSNTDPTDDSEW